MCSVEPKRVGMFLPLKTLCYHTAGHLVVVYCLKWSIYEMVIHLFDVI